MNNKQLTKNKPSIKTWFQSWMLKITRAFGLDAVQGNNETRASRIQKYGERVAQAGDVVMRQEGWRSFGFAGSRPARPKGSGGDTIVEVILATALIAAATGLAYSMSNHNLSNGVSAGQRSQALSVAQAQIERIKNAYLTNSTLLNNYIIDRPFCILGDGSEEDLNHSGSKCTNFAASTYSVSINYDKNTQVFTTGVNWSSSSNSSNQDQLTLYYKLPIGFAVGSNNNNLAPPPGNDQVEINTKYSIGPSYSFPSFSVYANQSNGTPVNNGNPIFQKTYDVFCGNNSLPGATCDITQSHTISLTQFGISNANSLLPNGQIRLSFGSSCNSHGYSCNIQITRLWINSVTVSGSSVDPAKTYSAGSVSQPLLTTGTGTAFWITGN